MKYMCFCYYDTAKFASLSQAEAEDIGRNCQPHDAALRATGKVFAQGSFSLPEQWRWLQPCDGRPALAHGPYQDSTAQAGAFLIVEADSIDEAVAVASKHAAANYGEQLGFAVDVRACDMFEWAQNGDAAKC